MDFLRIEEDTQVSKIFVDTSCIWDLTILSYDFTNLKGSRSRNLGCKGIVVNIEGFIRTSTNSLRPRYVYFERAANVNAHVASVLIRCFHEPQTLCFSKVDYNCSSFESRGTGQNALVRTVSAKKSVFRLLHDDVRFL